MLIASILLFMDFPPLITALLSAPSEVQPKEIHWEGLKDAVMTATGKQIKGTG